MSVAGKTTYDYSNDAVWSDLKMKIKEREDFLRSIKYFIDVVDENTGEVTRVMQPAKKVTDYIKSEF